ncbi:hypothetical protein like AT4G26240 [Hibiscus trionum]|uniref:Uncharacterized protein n=1 Tax=Hibiscus trionum TaxID=183268 RepID=A0A9W7LXB0_HIBTR|nr:hypothetical protein like AT4G26240 [Hibiscus trionum]
MRKLARQLHNSGDEKFSLPTVDDDRPMDINEQEELVRSLEEMHARQSLKWKSVFAALLFCYSAFLLFSVFHQTLFPWELRYHAYFIEDVDSWMIITSDWLAVLACSLAIMGLFSNSKDHRKWLWYSCSLAFVLAIFWAYHMLRMPKFRWDIIWLPLAPLCGAGLCIYVDHVLSESSEEVRKLRSYMYAFKAG